MIGTRPDSLFSSQLEELAPSSQRVAACGCGPSVYAKPGSYPYNDLLIICNNYPHGLRAHRRIAEGTELTFLVTERDLIESDVRKGALGDFLTDKLVYPYRPLENQSYLESLALEAQKRIATEEARDLVTEYGEMCRGLVIKPEFFALARMRKRARVFLPSMDEYLRLLEPSVRAVNIAALRNSFERACLGLKGEVLELTDHQVTILDSFVDKWLSRRGPEQVVNILRQSQRAFYSYLTRGRAVYLDLDLLARELYTPLRIGLSQELAGMQPEDPKNHLYLRTAEGLASLNERASLEDIVSKLRPGATITVSPLAGVLNEVFLITAGKEQFVAKKFTDWHGFKWFTLNLVSFGGKLFAVSGRARMSNEYGMNRYLARKSIKVAKVVHVSLKEGILVESYISGIPIADVVVRILTGGVLSRSQYDLIKSLGRTLSEIHSVGVSLGDSKPENFIAAEGALYVVDLEQAGRRKDYAWDIAELLLYAGHYSTSQTPSRGLSEMVQAFIDGYLQKGDATQLRRAAGIRYARVFSMWTPTPIILEISKLLREAR